MNLSDIIALAKAGYKLNDIKELIELGKEAQTSGVEKPAEAELGKEAQTSGVEKPAEAEPKEAPQPDPEKIVEKPAPAVTGETDKIKELEAQLAQVRKDLEKAQKQNTNRDNSGAAGSPDPQAVLNDIARKFM